MGILDDAIREHLDLKRKHGARDAELRELEDEALGSSERPDPFTAGEFFGEGATAAVESVEEAPALPEDTAAGGEEPTRLVEPSEEPPMPGQEEIPEEIPGQENLLEQDVPPEETPVDEPLEGYRPVEERPSTEEAESLGDLPDPPAPSESLEELIAEEEPFPEDTAAPPPAEPEPEEADEPPAPPEPESSVPEPPPPPPESGPEPPGRARGRVDVPTQEHPPPGDTGDLPPITSESELRPQPLDQVDMSAPADEPLAEDSGAGPGGPALYDFESDDQPVDSARAVQPFDPAGDDQSFDPEAGGTEDDFDALGPAEEEAPYLDEEEPYAEEPGSTTFEEPGTAVRPVVEGEGDLEGDLPEAERSEEEDSDDLWFEKGPPKDFDFDD